MRAGDERVKGGGVRQGRRDETKISRPLNSRHAPYTSPISLRQRSKGNHAHATRDLKTHSGDGKLATVARRAGFLA